MKICDFGFVHADGDGGVDVSLLSRYEASGQSASDSCSLELRTRARAKKFQAISSLLRGWLLRLLSH